MLIFLENFNLLINDIKTFTIKYFRKFRKILYLNYAKKIDFYLILEDEILNIITDET